MRKGTAPIRSKSREEQRKAEKSKKKKKKKKKKIRLSVLSSLLFNRDESNVTNGYSLDSNVSDCCYLTCPDINKAINTPRSLLRPQISYCNSTNRRTNRSYITIFSILTSLRDTRDASV